MRLEFIRRGIAPDKVTTIFNWAPTSEVDPSSRSENLRSRLNLHPECLIYMYAGNHGIAQDLSAWIDAAHACSDLKNVAFVFVGEGTEKDFLIEKVRVAEIENCFFLAGVPPEEFREVAIQADAQIISLRDDPLFSITIPSKVQACMSRGQAILASLTGDAADLVSQSCGGFVAKPSDIPSIELAIRKATDLGRVGLRQQGLRGREYYSETMSEAVAERLLRQILSSTVRLE
jgi:glycosyltransferase involved in cell wall biosynthesis